MTDAERYAFDLRGFVVRRAVLATAELRDLNDAVDALALAPPGDSIESQRFENHLHTSPSFVALLDHEAVLEVVADLCGPDLRLDHAYGIVMAPGTDGLGLHGSGWPFDRGQYYVARSDGIHCGLVAVQWALVDHPPGAGGFLCVPGSHRASFPTPWETVRDYAVTVPLGAGDVVVFTESLTHGTARWTAAHQRRTLLYKYTPGSLAWGKAAPPPARLAAMLTDRQRRLFEPPYVAYRRPVV
jgi:ectoine hydroxylase-related dioxygenase (phytanoyl-CoA dioxygenase family)